MSDSAMSRRTVLLGAAAAAAAVAVGAGGEAVGGEAAESDATHRRTGAAPLKHSRAATTMPTLFLPHGGGPCFFMQWTMGPPDTWHPLAAWLRQLPATLPAQPQALLVVSAHWEQGLPTVLSAPRPPLLFDYYGFPKHTYALQWPAPGAPDLARRVRGLLQTAGIPSAEDATRGLDHGVFVPLKVAWRLRSS